MLKIGSFRACVFLFILCWSLLGQAPFVYAALDQWEAVTPAGTTGYIFNTIASIGNYVFLGTDNGVYRSADKGATWTQINTGLTNLNVRAIAIQWSYSAQYDFDVNTNVYIATAGGIFQGTIGGSSWVAANSGLSDFDIRDIKINQYDFLTVYAAVVGSSTPGVYKSTDYGVSWIQTSNVNISGENITKLVSDFALGKIYALSESNRLFSSDLESNSAIPESWSVLREADATVINDITVSNTNGGINWIATDTGILKSDTFGLNWASSNTGITDLNINTVASAYGNADIAYGASVTGGVYKTNDIGSSWTKINKNLSDVDIRDIKTTPNNDLLVYAVASSSVHRLELTNSSVNPIAVADTTAPSQISLTIDPNEIATSTVTLRWFASGDDGNSGTATSYDIRYATTTISDGNWSTSTQVSNEPTPQIAGASESYTVSGLNPATVYYFAIKVSDEIPNTSVLSNNVTATTQTVSDTTPPIITILGNNPTTIERGLTYTDAGATATDNIDISITVTSSSTVNTNIAGSYTVTYSATDAANNSTSSVRTVIVSATTPVVVSGGGGGGGGGGSSAPTITTVANTNATTNTTTSFVQTQSPAISVNSSLLTIAHRSSSISQPLSRGMQSDEVKILQGMLAKDISLYPEQSIIGIFGPATQRAVIRFQNKYNIMPAYGFVGPLTMKKLNELYGETVPTTTHITSTIVPLLPTKNSSSASITQSLSRGMQSDEVKILQGMLAKDISLYPEQSIIGIFGPATQRAVIRFQNKYNIMPAYGFVGPLTMKKLNELYGN